jgi:hypothetical protein
VIRVDGRIHFLIEAVARDTQQSTGLRLKLCIGGQIYPNGTRIHFHLFAIEEKNEIK